MVKILKLGTDTSVKKNFLPGIQHLRGLAAAMVVLGHTDSMSVFDKYYNIRILPDWFNNLGLGILGVQLFFVISGFIMVVISVENLTLKSTINARKFLTNRFIRIIPYMWLCIVIYAVIRYISIDYFPVLLYIKSFLLYPIGELAPPYIWTLRHEVLFYFLFYFFYLKFHKPIFLYLWFLSPLLWIYYKFNNTITPQYQELQEWLDFFFNKNNLLFGMGYLLGVLYKKQKLKLINIYSNGFLLSIIFIIVLLAIPLISPALNNYMLATTLSQTIIIGLLCMVVLYLTLGINNSNKVNFLENIGIQIGNSSYSIYLLHGIFVSAILQVFVKTHLTFNPWLIGILSVIMACFWGYLAFVYLEKPLIKYLKKLAK